MKKPKEDRPLTTVERIILGVVAVLAVIILFRTYVWHLALSLSVGAVLVSLYVGSKIFTFVKRRK